MNEWFEAEQRVERAQQLSESHRWVEALAEIEAALEINPHNAAWHAHHGFLLEELDRPDEAVKAYDRSLEIEPDDSDVVVALGAVLSREGRYAPALKIFENLARLRPDYEPAYCHRVSIYAELGKHEQAEEMFYLAQELDKDCPHCFVHIATSLAARGERDRALFCWKKALELDPEYPGVRDRIARVYRAQGKLEAANESLLEELRQDPGNTELMFELGSLAVQGGQFATAAARFAQIVELEPNHLRARFAWAEALLTMHEPKQALECLEKVRSLDPEPELPAFHRRVGEALLQLERYEESKRALDRATEREPDSPVLSMLLGHCLVGLGRFTAAADQYRRVLAADAESHVAHYNLAVCMSRTGRIESALHHCLETLRYAPTFAPAMHRAIVAYMWTGRWSDARSMIQRAKRQDPADRVVNEFSRRFRRMQLRYSLKKLFGGIRFPFARRSP